MTRPFTDPVSISSARPPTPHESTSNMPTVAVLQWLSLDGVAEEPSDWFFDDGAELFDLIARVLGAGSSDRGRAPGTPSTSGRGTARGRRGLLRNRPGIHARGWVPAESRDRQPQVRAIGQGSRVPRITLHGTRHTWATLALLEGIPAKVVAEVLGHSWTQVTLDVYSHVTPGMQSDATSRVASLLTGA
jgi:hypothetical protein